MKQAVLVGAVALLEAIALSTPTQADEFTCASNVDQPH